MEIKRINDFYTSTNVYVLFDEETKEAAVVDPGGSPDVVIEYLKEEGLNLKYIILTHGHADHIGYVKNILDYKKVPVVAHKDEKDMLNHCEHNLSNRMRCGKVEFDADIYVEDKDSLYLGKTKLGFIHTPGHTEGGMCIRTENNLITGDTLFKGSMGRCDLYGGDERKMKKSLNKIKKFENELAVYPGHGDPTVLGNEKQNNPYLTTKYIGE
ncbi:MBL fold metallo-hydrolase [Peptacetobacter sp.]|uniref:MBL fold metallo-hydrolase n=1 Tax=Peptacetobacter sp. TaxID=2991975 RepID=UPI002619E742|nr:MBL fold metallo-hydrolase [Peptacetobacter sp.]